MNMNFAMNRLLGPMIAALLAAAQAAAAQGAAGTDATTVAEGKALFTRLCTPCHGAARSDMGRAMLPGTDALRIKYKGTLPALLEQRTDLTPQVIRTFVRRGTWSMPPLRKTEISDAEIDAVSAYIADAARTQR
jgi:mono/diheme cytochrome c family protein